MEACLQDHREEGGFSDRCREALEERMERQAADFELNYGLRCVGDWRLCGGAGVLWARGVLYELDGGCIGQEHVPCSREDKPCRAALAPASGGGHLVIWRHLHRHWPLFRGPLSSGGLFRASSNPLCKHACPPNCSEYCAEDIEELCKEQREAIAMAEGFGADAQVITCLEVGGRAHGWGECGQACTGRDGFSVGRGAARCHVQR